MNEVSMKPSYIPRIPADVPRIYHDEFIANYQAITKGTNRLLLFAADHKIEHLNTDFYGPDIHPDALDPHHLFNIASKAPIGAMTTHLGLIARYAKQFEHINYMVKLNGKTNSLAKTKHDPISLLLSSIDEVVAFKQTSGLPIRGIGITLYIGSEYEGTMLVQAAHAIYHAHQYGLLATVWGYLFNGSHTTHDVERHTAGIAGLANSLGADFVKIKPIDSAYMTIVTQAAGNTQVLCAGGNQLDTATLLEQTYQQLKTGNTAGSAIGRNIFQHSLTHAVSICEALALIIYENKSAQEASKKLLL